MDVQCNRSLQKNCHYFSSKSGSSLSNFFKCNLRIWDIDFSSVEQAYQYKKAVYHKKERIARQILYSSDSYQVYKLGKSITPSHRWHRDKIGFMKLLLLAKYNQCPVFQKELKNTDRKILIEDTPNPFWGRGADDNGRNMLGVLLTELRFSQK